ncbi:hypothetical protein ACFWZA_15670 [[Kitasatospora] papulosa]|uniref:hypothetical protein n=1 Tax=[Kitasatospora] papulosa TaxID=1464011 RepID=UPI00369CFB53
MRNWKFWVPPAVNLLLGLPAIVPLFLIWYFLTNGPLASLGWTQQDPNEDDGMLLWLVIIVPVVAFFAALWALVNLSMRSKLITDDPPYPYWLVSVVLTLVPSFGPIAFGWAYSAGQSMLN